MGTILPYVGDIKDIPKKWSLCDGTNGTPDLTGRFLEGVTSNPKKFKEAGLPNITGYLSFRAGEGGYDLFNANGSFYSVLSVSAQPFAMGSGYLQHRRAYFDASRVSAIYRNDITTVQPASYTVLYIIKIKK